jgi:hypothetical protein
MTTKKSLLSAALLLSACSSPVSPEQQRLMDTIEARVQLPRGAHSVSQYARYYAFDDSRRIVAIYTTSVFPNLPDHDLQVGRRRWVSRDGHLPNISGGVCETVHVVFSPATNEFEQAACNGGRGLPPAQS